MKKPEKLSKKNDFLESAKGNKGKLVNKERISVDIKYLFINAETSTSRIWKREIENSSMK